MARPASALSWLTAAIALHSLLLGSLLILRPFLVLELADWPYAGTRFFPAQSGIFLLILGVVYAAAVRRRGYLWILVMSKGAAVLFLGGELLRGSCPPVVLFQAGADFLMGASVFALLLVGRSRGALRDAGRRWIMMLALLLSISGSATAAAEQGVELGRFRVLLHSGLRIEGRRGRIFGGRLEGVGLRGEQLSYELEDVHELERGAGSKAGKYAGIGVVFAATTMMFTLIRVQNDPNATIDMGKVVHTSVGLIGISALFGGLIGHSHTTWEAVDPASLDARVSVHGITLSRSWSF